MNALPVFRNHTLIILAACCAFGIATAQAQTYILTDLGVLPDETSSIPAALNGKGQVTGTSGTSAFRYTSADVVMEDIGNPGNNSSRGFAINTSGQVVGDSTFGESEVSHAALFENGLARDLAAFESSESFSRANGINASGQVVGVFGSKSKSQYGRAFITNMSGLPRRLIDLGTLGGMYAQALAINDSGFVTGNSETFGFHTITTVGITRAFLWSPATKGMVDLGVLGGDYSYGTCINANNHVAGYSTINSSDNRLHAFLHDGLAMRDLGSLDPTSAESDRSFALGVNSADQVVGYSYVQSSVAAVVYPPVPGPVEQVAFIYTQGMMRDLNTLIGNTAKRYRLYSATAINERGQITAIAHEESSDSFHAVLLTPSLDIPMGRPLKTQLRKISVR